MIGADVKPENHKNADIFPLRGNASVLNTKNSGGNFAKRFSAGYINLKARLTDREKSRDDL